MKIAFISEHFNPARGGQETYMNDFSAFLITKGHEVDFFTQDEIEDRDGLKFHHIKITGLAKKFRWLQWLSFQRNAKNLTDKGNYDIVMGTGKCAGVNIYQPHGGTVRASQRQNAILVRNGFITAAKTFFNSLSPKHIVARNSDDSLYANKNTHFIAISKMVRAHMKEFYDVDDSKIHLIYNGIDTTRFSPATDEHRHRAREEFSLPLDKVIFSIVAHNFKLKGIRELIETLVEVKKQRSDFLAIVVGNGKKKSFVKYAKKMGVADQIQFLGAVSNPERIYTASDVYVQPTWYVPCSLVVLEALAAGLPVITSSFNGAGEFIEQGKDGYVISRPDSKEEFTAALLELFDAEKRKAIGLAARKKIEPHTLANNFTQMLNAFEQVAGKK